METVEELILNSCLHTKRPGLATKKRKQKKMQPRTSQITTYGSIVSYPTCAYMMYMGINTHVYR